VERAEIEFVAAVAPGLEGAEQAGLLEVLQRLVGQPPQAFRICSTLLQGRK
jgi:hypothetical protein